MIQRIVVLFRGGDAMQHTDNSTKPAIAAWVGCLNCYNEARLTGQWVDEDAASLYPDEFAATGCTRPGHEEFE